MDMGIVNAQHCIADAYEKLDKELLGFIEDVLLNRCENATERMMEYAATIDPKSKPTAVRKLGTRRDVACASQAFVLVLSEAGKDVANAVPGMQPCAFATRLQGCQQQCLHCLCRRHGWG
jgi:hypothetical protein